MSDKVRPEIKWRGESSFHPFPRLSLSLPLRSTPCRFATERGETSEGNERARLTLCRDGALWLVQSLSLGTQFLHHAHTLSSPTHRSYNLDLLIQDRNLQYGIFGILDERL